MKAKIAKKTYGVYGMTEWHIQLPTGLNDPGLSHFNISFTGGQLTGYGVAPATFTTDDPFVQKVIESSIHFSKGKKRIHLLKTKKV